MSTPKNHQSDLFLWERISALMKDRCINAKEIAEIAGVVPSAVAKWKTGGKIGADKLQRIADHFGESVDWLLGRSESKSHRSGFLDSGQPDAPRIKGDKLKIGSIETREIVEYRAVSREWLEAEVAAMIELLPTAPEGRGRLHLIRRMLEMLFELQERCADVIKGHKRSLPTNSEGKEGGGE